ncbi:hypothetical protein FT641_19370 [Bacillus paranthracis]|uniref:hypothetical protein n=1 Tax=Bacillus paranthracis TaxID=2026186 RepID=UPI00187AA2E5|nr:hypothetical protein [Bacillus paranthracis]MBE7114274.1 hypothetical protein [Bacillus paranthracis]MBE7154853.1 hypothetical protein [Bacillus paranthracis]
MDVSRKWRDVALKSLVGSGILLLIGMCFVSLKVMTLALIGIIGSVGVNLYHSAKISNITLGDMGATLSSEADRTDNFVKKGTYLAVMPILVLGVVTLIASVVVLLYLSF